MNEEKRIMMRFLVALGKINKEIFQMMVEVYGKESPCLRTIEKWVSKFRRGEMATEDKNRMGRPSNQKLRDSIENYLNDYPFISAKMIAKLLKYHTSTITSILKKEMNYKKIFFQMGTL